MSAIEPDASDVVHYEPLSFCKSLQDIVYYDRAWSLAFLAGIAVNYLIGIWFVFRRGNLTLKRELFLFVTVSLLALAVTEGSMYLLTDLLRIDYRISRLISGVVTYLFNFFSRRQLIYRSPQIGDQE